MFNINVSGSIFAIDSAKFESDLRAEVERQVQEAAKAFAEAALLRIPIRTGFVAGAFGTLAELIGVQARFNPIVSYTRRVGGKLVQRQLGREYYYPPSGGRVSKDSQSGQQFATQQKDIFQWVGQSYVFNYDVDITYFRINDSVAGHAPTAPWGAIIAAQQAFEDSINQNSDFRLTQIIEQSIFDVPIR